MNLSRILDQIQDSNASDDSLMTPVHIDFSDTEETEENKKTEKKKVKVRKIKTIKKYCCLRNCKNNSTNSSAKFFRLQKRPEDLLSDATTKKDRKISPPNRSSRSTTQALRPPEI